MSEALLVLAGLVAWFILFSWALPKLGVKT
jgi:hypothetical protein